MNESQASRAAGAKVPLAIRAARPADLPAVWEMLLALAEYERLADRVSGSVEQLGEHLFADPRRLECIVADRGGELVGYALFYPTYSSFRTQPMMWLEDLFVRPEARGSGAGRALMAHLSALVLERGAWRLSWEVLDWNQPSIEFYEHAGARRSHPDWFTYALDEAGLRALAGGH